MANYCLSVTYQCNWDCNYCCADTHNRKEPSRDFLDFRLNEIEPESDVSITGGEPGLIPDELMSHIFDSLEAKNCRITVNTNGLFFKKHAKYIPRVAEFLYHCTLTFKNKVWLPEGWEKLNIDFMCVVADDTVDRLKSFLEKNKHLKIAVYSADRHIVNGKPGVSLSHKNRIRAYQECKEYIREDMVEFLFNTCKQVNDQNGLIHL